jgi:N-acetylglucosamine kinase-like BadF-type ATPase
VYAGIDGGQSSTIAVILDAYGTQLGRGTAGPSDHVGEPPNSRRAAVACESAVAAALAAGKFPADTPLAAVVIGMSGYEGQWHGRQPMFGDAVVRYKHDAVIALAGAIRERPAGVVISGTGSVAYGEDAHREPVRAGGFGYLFGDEGSGFAIARAALAGAMRASDRGVTTDLGDAALAYFDCPDLRALARAVSLHEIGRPQLAAFSRVVLDAARLGDPAARIVVDEAATSLALLAAQIAEQLHLPDAPPVPIAFVGGTVANADFHGSISRRLAGLTTNARVVAPAFEPAVGAAYMAMDAASAARPRG